MNAARALDVLVELLSYVSATREYEVDRLEIGEVDFVVPDEWDE
jgi:hypothetical protein